MKKLFLTIIIILSVTSCQKHTMRDTLGLTKSAPNEFLVIPRNKLEVPTTFKLVTPSEKKKVILSNKIRNEAHSIITGNVDNVIATKNDDILLQRTNITTTKNIRNIISQEHAESQKEQSGFISSIQKEIQSFQDVKDPNILDADAEQKRLKAVNKNE